MSLRVPPLTRFFHPLVETRRLGDVPLRATLAGEPYVFFRDHRRNPAALRDQCPHRFAPLSAGRVRPDGRLACPYHGWHFDAQGRGVSPSQPTLARCDVEAFQVLDRYGFLWIASRDTPLEHMPALEDPSIDQFVGTLALRFRAPLYVCLDNFSEDEHTPWVHSRLGWRERDAGAVEFRADNFDDRTEVHYTAPQRASLLLPAAGLRDGDLFHNDWVTHFDPVRTDYVISWSDPRTGDKRPVGLRAQIFMVPETEKTTLFHIVLFARVFHRAWRALVKPLGPVLRALVWKEMFDDQRFVRLVADTPESMKGMRLGRFDKPLIHNRRLLSRLYYGTGETASV